MKKTLAETDPRQDLAELQRRVLAGDPGVTPADLAKARAAAEFAELQTEAAKRKAETDAAEAHEAQIAALRKDIEAARDLGTLTKAYSKLQEAIKGFNDALGSYRDSRVALTKRAASLGIGDEADVLPSLDRDWLTVATDESQGRYLRSRQNRRSADGFVDHPIAHHELTSAKERQRIDAEDLAQRDRRVRRHTQQQQAKAKEAAEIAEIARRAEARQLERFAIERTR